MIILDTNVVSALMRPRPDRAVEDWLNGQSIADLWMNSVSLFELRFGLLTMESVSRRDAYDVVLHRILALMDERVAAFDAESAARTAELMARRKKSGRPVDLRDSMIAGIALANRATVATRNTKHFSDLSIAVLNPWDSATPPPNSFSR
jgi:predicted nucleic acid-binding protein